MHKTIKLEDIVRIDLPKKIYPEGFYIFVVPTLAGRDGDSDLVTCILGHKKMGVWKHMFGVCESVDEVILMAKNKKFVRTMG